MDASYRVPIKSFPRLFGKKNNVVLIRAQRPVKSFHDEEFLTARVMTNLRILGECYSCLSPTYFNEMPRDSGILVTPFIQSRDTFPDMSFPGDVDLLAIPYEGREMILSRAVAIEIKIIRACYLNKGKSPNQYGFSQAEALLQYGFPYAAVGHIIVSDDSPKEEHRRGFATRIVDDEGTLSEMEPTLFDPMPTELIDRAYGRLQANCPESNIGFFTTYARDDERIFRARGKEALTRGYRLEVLEAIYEYYQKETDFFVKAPRY